MPSLKERRAAYQAQYNGVRKPGILKRTPGITVPDSVLAERNRSINSPRSITASFCGDPLPGRSALDRVVVRSRAHDPLDDLIFRRVALI